MSKFGHGIAGLKKILISTFAIHGNVLDKALPMLNLIVVEPTLGKNHGKVSGEISVFVPFFSQNEYFLSKLFSCFDKKYSF